MHGGLYASLTRVPLHVTQEFLYMLRCKNKNNAFTRYVEKTIRSENLSAASNIFFVSPNTQLVTISNTTINMLIQLFLNIYP